MYNTNKMTKTSIKVNKSLQGETIEQKLERIINNGEPIKDGAPLVYTERKNGVEAQYDIRTDRFEVAVEAMDKVTKSHLAKREERGKVVEMKKDQNNDKNVGGAEPIQGTNKDTDN